MTSLRDSLLLAALLSANVGSVALAQTPADAPVMVAQANTADDDEDDPAPGAKPVTTTTTPT